MNEPCAYFDPARCAVRTALGSDMTAVMRRLDAGERVREPLGWRGYQVRECAPIPGEPPGGRHARFVKRMGLWGIDAALEAGRSLAASPRVGVFAGYGGLRPDWDETLPRLEHQTDDGKRPWYRGLKDFHPFWMLNHLSNNAHAIVATELGLTGDGATYGGTNAGIVAIEAAIDALACGALDAALVFAYDSLIQPETLVEWPLGEHTRDWIPGEAAAAVVLTAVMYPGARPVTASSGAGSAEDSGPDEVRDALGELGAAYGLLRLIRAARRGESVTISQACAPDLHARLTCAAEGK